jgi:CBS domain-containing protein
MRVAGVRREEFRVSADTLVERVKDLLHEGNITRIVVKDDAGKVLLEIPATVGVAGVIIAPWLAALGVIAALATNCTMVVERKE